MSKKILEQRNVELELLKKYFSGRCTPEEEKQVESWFSDPSYEKVLKYKILEHWNEFDVSGEPDINGKKLLDRVYHQIYRSEWEYNRKSFLHKAYIKFAKAAAILLIPLLIFGAWYISKTVFTKDIGFAEIYSPMGARTHFRLPDGSQGWLNSGSTLRFPVKFVGRTRQVMLTGQGYFDVIKNPDKPFVVDVQNLKIIALGTKFDVLAYPDEKKIDVVLESGEVVINEKKKKDKEIRVAELMPGEKVRIDVGKNICHKKKVNTDKYTAWREGKLIFRNDPMPEVIEKINRWYNVELIIKDKEIEDYVLRATFEDETLDEVLKMMKIISPIDYYVPKRNIKQDGIVCRQKIYLYLRKPKIEKERIS